MTRDRAQDTDPTWSADGRWLVFSSDRTGIYNLFAYRRRYAWSAHRQLTNLVTGAFQPSISPDGRTDRFSRATPPMASTCYRTPFAPEKPDCVVARTNSDRLVDIDDTVRAWPPKNPDVPRVCRPPARVPTGTGDAGKTCPSRLDGLGDYDPLPDPAARSTTTGTSVPVPRAPTSARSSAHCCTSGSDARATNIRTSPTLTYGTLTEFPGRYAVGYNLDVLEPTFSLCSARRTR